MADVKLSESRMSVDGWDSDGSLSWEEFFGSTTEDLVPSLLEMYDVLIGRSGPPDPNEKDPPRFQEVISAKKPSNNVNYRNWSNRIERNWHCRCTGKSSTEAITRCSSCNTEPEIRSTDIRDSKIINDLGDFNANNCQSVPNLDGKKIEKCELVTCPAGFSTPSTPIQQRFGLNRSPVSLKRNNSNISRSESDYLCVPRPLSISSIASSSSSSSGTSSCSGARRLGIPHKSSAYLASIESLEDDSDSERGLQKNEARFKSNGSQGSEDSGVHSPCSYISSPSPPQGRPKYCDPHLSYMDRVVMEIIETEGVYVRDLQKIIEGYLLKWRSLPDFPLTDRLDDLFSNIEDIYHFNSLFLRELEICGLDPVKVAGCFVRNNVGFSVYTEYCTNYPRTVSSLTELMRQEGTVRLFRERQTALQHTLPLGSYLLKPVQRILKYHLLLQNIVKQYPSSNEGYKDIVDALSAMTGIAQHINDMKRKHEHAVRVQEIQSLLYGWEGEDLTTFGELCAEGTFRMSGAKALRHVFLFDKMVLITKKKEEGILGYKAHINCSNLMLIESVPGEPLSFHVIPFDNPRLQYTLQARNLEQKREWTLQLKRVILENYNAVIPSHARQLVMELGQNRTDDEIMADKSLPKRQHSAPEYLEKRKQDRRKSETGLKSRLRRVRKSDTGNNSESQCNKPRTLHKKSSLGSHSSQNNSTSKTPILGAWRRKSEPGMYSRKDSETEDTNSLTEEPTAKTSDDTPEKISLDINDVEEIKNLEHIVAQLLMQNREFDKILKKQPRHRKKEATTKTDTTDDEDDGIYETLMNVKLVLDEDKNYDSDSDYVTLICGEDEEDEGKFKLKKQNSLKEGVKVQSSTVRRTRSFNNTEEACLKILEAPTSPSVWLKQQGEHLATPSNKAGSLPRSFQMNAESTSQNDPRAFRDFRISIERPFTIASDKPMFDMERYEKNRFLEGEDESLTEGLSTPGASSDHINVHPEYKIYKSGVSTNVLKNVINKLSHIKLDDKKSKKASKVVYLIAKHYHKTLKNRINWISQNIHQGNNPKNDLPVYKQGSSMLGERLANFTDVNTHVRPSKKAAALLGVRPDSVLSLASNFSLENTKSAIECDKLEIDSDNDIYEKSFEAIDEILENDLPPPEEEEEIQIPPVKIPPPVPAKPKRILIEKTEPEIVCGNKVTQDLENRKEEEGDTSSQHSTASTVIEISPNAEILALRPRGWVRHIVGKLQGGM